MEDKWYNSQFGRRVGEYLGYAALLVGLGICLSFLSSGPNHYTELEKAKVEAASRTEFQRLRTIEEIVRAQGAKLSSDDLSKLLKNNGLSEKK